jgi:hypothetical protein
MQSRGRRLGSLQITLEFEPPSLELPELVFQLHGAEDGPDTVDRLSLGRKAPQRLRVGLLAHDRGLTGRDDLLAVFDRQADLAIEQAIPTLVDRNLVAAKLLQERNVPLPTPERLSLSLAAGCKTCCNYA